MVTSTGIYTETLSLLHKIRDVSRIPLVKLLAEAIGDLAKKYGFKNGK